MTGNNPIVSFFDALLDHIPVPSLSGQDNKLSKQFLQEVERYELEAQRFQAIKQHRNEIPDRSIVDDSF
ncbi:hypothetical protein [Anaerovibrio sp.]|uniref:hypothetical protein n=1 Tax=Anaerovibrio sp. TaxID=1872532 RepID=UPI00388F51BA